jgi:hypothetical protein
VVPATPVIDTAPKGPCLATKPIAMPEAVRAWIVKNPRPTPTAAELGALAAWGVVNYRYGATAYDLCGPQGAQ